MASRAELFGQIEEAAKAGDFDLLKRISREIESEDKKEFEAKIAAGKEQRQTWSDLVGEALSDISIAESISDLVFVVTARHLSGGNGSQESLTVGVNSQVLFDLVKNALADLIPQAPDTIASMVYDSGTKEVTINTLGGNGKSPATGSGTRVMGWSSPVKYGGAVVGLAQIYKDHCTTEDKAIATKILAGTGRLGDKSGRTKAEINSDMHTLKEGVATRAGFSH